MSSGAPTHRLGVVGFAHMHVNELIARFSAIERVRFVACADTVPSVPSATGVDGSRRANLARALRHPDAPRAYEDEIDMLEREELDIVIVCPEISRHVDVTEAAAARGVHVVTEKPMAGRLSDARRMARAARDAGAALLTNWPTTWEPAIRKVKDLVDAGEIGDVWEVRWRNGASLGPLAAGSTHPGDTVVSGEPTDAEKAAEWWYRAEDGGGALLDYCSYGAHLSTWYLGRTARSVTGFTANVSSPFGDVEDNAVVLVRFPQAIAVLEGTWTTAHAGTPAGPVVYGSSGTIVVDGSRVLVFADRDDPEPTHVHAGDPLPAGRATIAEELIAHIEHGEPLHPTLDIPLNLATVAILDAGLRSAANGAHEPVERADPGGVE